MTRGPTVALWVLACCAVLRLPVSHAETAGITPPREVTASDCLHCHGAHAGVEGDPKLLVDTDALKRSVHAGKVECDECHVGVDMAAHKMAPDPVDCTRCHGPSPSRVPAEFRGRADSIHQRAREEGSFRVPSCKFCHGTHDIQPPQSPGSKVNRSNIRETCGECHAHPDTLRGKAAPQTAVEFDKSIHGRASSEPGIVAATCTDCHLPHHPSEPASTHPIQKHDLPEICGRCHSDILKEYRGTIHGRDLAEGNEDVPSCADCHGEHTIRRHEDAESSVAPQHVVQTCTKCHENKQLQRRYGLPADRAETYEKSYHGISNRLGDIRAAHCATCHTAHRILPSSDPASSVHPANLKHTCGRQGCHEGSTKRFEVGSVHLTPSAKSEAWVYWVGVCYKLLVAAIVGFFCLNIALDLLKRVTLRWTEGGDSR